MGIEKLHGTVTGGSFKVVKLPMDYKTMEILIMEKTNLYFGVILGVRIATFA